MSYCYVTCFFSTDLGGGTAPSQRRSEYKLASLRICFLPPAFLKAWLPPGILSILFGFSRLVALFFFLSGWVGFPLPCFPPPPCFCGVFLSSGWLGSPCRVFPVFSPCFSGGLGGVFVFRVFCYLLHLASFLSPRPKLGKDGLPTRKPPGPPRPFTWHVRPDPSPAGSRRVDVPSERAGG